MWSYYSKITLIIISCAKKYFPKTKVIKAGSCVFYSQNENAFFEPVVTYLICTLKFFECILRFSYLLKLNLIYNAKAFRIVIHSTVL